MLKAQEGIFANLLTISRQVIEAHSAPVDEEECCSLLAQAYQGMLRRHILQHHPLLYQYFFLLRKMHKLLGKLPERLKAYS